MQFQLTTTAFLLSSLLTFAASVPAPSDNIRITVEQVHINRWCDEDDDCPKEQFCTPYNSCVGYGNTIFDSKPALASKGNRWCDEDDDCPSEQFCTSDNSCVGYGDAIFNQKSAPSSKQHRGCNDRQDCESGEWCTHDHECKGYPSPVADLARPKPCRNQEDCGSFAYCNSEHKCKRWALSEQVILSE
ncbi:uncharacterized protein RSE6_03663 [Rhynchosporium secalis]|uniref:Uncharacterized protein n=1 Tax=Rhynchosporium secalis TaxID=38038 RepID=A0A1E1M3C3_RHYSE|nr:uncharacterized protein RSE6_03663 [Rhynchosporium secalis]